MISSGAFKANNSDQDRIRNAASDTLATSEWTCVQGFFLNKTRSALPFLYEVEIDKDHTQTNESVPAICSPNNDSNATCHSFDVLLTWGALNSKTKNVDPYYNDEDIGRSQLIHGMFGAFFRARNLNPHLGFLKVRGPSYATVHAIFAGNKQTHTSHESGRGGGGYRIQQYLSKDRSLALLEMPRSFIADFEDSGKFTVFYDYALTFQRAQLID